jgi:hypothetical protein
MRNSHFKLIILLALVFQVSGAAARIQRGNYDESSLLSSGSGDVVGNGRIIIDDFFLDVDDSTIYLKEDEVLFRNQQFDYILDNLDLDPLSSGTGDVVGNGGGFIESLTYFYFQTLERHISSSLSQKQITFDPFERRILSRMLSYIPSMRGDKLRFISGRKAKVLFYISGLDAAPRLAKTGFSPNYPIYFNTDLLYKEVKAKPELLLGLLVHELGHQLGVADHGILDNLGAKVVQVANANEQKVSTILEDGDLEVTIQNHFFQSAPSDVFISYGNRSVEVLKWKPEQLRSICGREYIQSAFVYNFHWSSRLFDFGSEVLLTAKGWLDVKCFNSETGKFSRVERNLEVLIDISDGEVKGDLKVTK